MESLKPTIAFVVMGFWGRWNWTRVGFLVVLLTMFGGLILTLRQAERRLADASVDRALRAVQQYLRELENGA
jgi:hypothetical protein